MRTCPRCHQRSISNASLFTLKREISCPACHATLRVRARARALPLETLPMLFPLYVLGPSKHFDSFAVDMAACGLMLLGTAFHHLARVELHEKPGPRVQPVV